MKSYDSWLEAPFHEMDDTDAHREYIWVNYMQPGKEYDVMNLEEELLKFILKKLETAGKNLVEVLRVEIPTIKASIPKLKLSEAIEILKNKYGKTELEGDLDPEGEKLISQYEKIFIFY